MSKNLVIGIIVLVVLIGGGAFLIKNFQESAPGHEVNELVSPEPSSSSVSALGIIPPNTSTVTLAAQNGSNESGSVTLKEDNGKVTVSIEVDGEPAGAIQPAHIHTGACPTPGAVKFPLSNVVNGKSETTVNTTFADLKAMEPLAINLHESSAKINNYISCGDLSL